MVKSKLPPRYGSLALRQLNPIHKRGHNIFFKNLVVGSNPVSHLKIFVVFLSRKETDLRRKLEPEAILSDKIHATCASLCWAVMDLVTSGRV